MYFYNFLYSYRSLTVVQMTEIQSLNPESIYINMELINQMYCPLKFIHTHFAVICHDVCVVDNSSTFFQSGAPPGWTTTHQLYLCN